MRRAPVTGGSGFVASHDQADSPANRARLTCYDAIGVAAAAIDAVAIACFWGLTRVPKVLKGSPARRMV